MHDVCRAISGPEDGRDAAQEALEKIVISIKSFDADKGSFRAWALTVARNVCRDRLRRKGLERRIFEDQGEDGMGHLPSEAPDAERIAYARIESPKGEIGFYLVSDGTVNPYRYNVRPPSFVNLTCLSQIAVGHKLAKQAARKVDECHAHNVVDGRVPELAVNELNGKRDKLIKDWMTVVKKRPDLYLQHKRRAIECMLRIDYDSGERFSYYLISRGAHGLGAGDPRQSRPGLIELQKKFWSTADLRGTWADWFEPLLWLALLSVASLVAVFRTRSRGLVSAFVLGNVMFLFSNFTFAPAPNLRYLFPLLTALWATAVVAAAGRRLRRSPRRIWRERRSAVASVGDVRQEEP